MDSYYSRPLCISGNCLILHCKIFGDLFVEEISAHFLNGIFMYDVLHLMTSALLLYRTLEASYLISQGKTPQVQGVEL